MYKWLALIAFSVITIVFGYQGAFAAEIIVDSPPPDGFSRCASGEVIICGGGFTLDSTETIADLHFWVTELNGPFDSIVEYRFHEANGNVPGDLVPSGSGIGIIVQTDPFVVDGSPNCDGTIPVGSDCQEVWMDLPIPITLNPGNYFVVIKNPNGGWNVLGQRADGEFVFSKDDGNTWTNVVGVIIPVVITGPSMVGGELLPIDSTALLLAGAQTNAVWILTALAVIGSVAFGVLYITSKKN